MAKSQSKELSNAKAVLKALGDSQEVRTDGYQNMLTKYGTKQDSSTAFSFVPEEFTDDYTLSINYQFNGLFAKIIDLPAGEAVSKGFKLNINNEDVEKEIMKKCAQLNLEENFETAIKWSRLYGGAIAVMLIYDGRGLDEPLNYKTIRGIDEIKVYESAVVNPLYNSSYYSSEPEYYQINALEGSFTVHASRCLVFRNGILPQQVCDSKRRIFGFAEYDRIKTALRETVTAHGYAPRMLERAIQSVIKIKDLASLLGTAKGEDFVVKRLQLIDMARSMFNSMAIDAEGEDFDFKAAPYTGVKEVLDSTCNMLSAETNIPQTLLFGSSPQGMDSTGDSDLENWYNYVGQIQKKTVKSPLETILGIIIQVLVRTGKIDDYPEWELEFEPLWSLSEAEQAQVDLTRAQIELTKAQTAQTYVGLGSLDPTEIRTGLAKKEEYHVETLLDDVPDDELFASMIDESSDDTPPVPPAMPQGGVEAEGAGNNIFEQGDFSEFAKDSEIDAPTAAAVLVVNSEGKILCGVRSDNKLVCGPGGHIEAGEQPIVAAIRETQEEFGITPTSLIPLATLGENNALHHKTDIFLCTSFSGTPKCDEKEMKLASFITLEELLENRDKMFKPFLDSLEVLAEVKKKAASLNSDEGNSNSGNHGHEGRPGEIGGSLPSGKQLTEKAQSAISKLWDGDEDAFYSEFGKVLKDMPEGSSFEMNGETFTKIGEGKFEVNSPYAGVYNETASELTEAIYDMEDMPSLKFSDIESEDVAEEKIESGELKPSETSAKTVLSSVKSQEDLRKLSEEEKINLVSELEAEDPDYLLKNNGSLASSAVITLGITGTPTMLEEKDFEEYVKKNNAPKIYRGVTDLLDQDEEVVMTAGEIEKDFMSNNKNPGMGGGNYGFGHHFADNYEGAVGYSKQAEGEGRLFECAVKPDAKIADFSACEEADKLGIERGLYLVISGYDGVYDEGTGIYNIVNREALVMKKPKANSDSSLDEDGDSKKTIDTVSTSAIMKSSDSQADGGPGSGNFGHEGRPGKRGGSAPEGEGSSSEGKSESKEEKKSESKKSEGSKKPPETHKVAPVKKTPAPEFKAKFDEAKATQAPEDAWRVDDTYTVEDYEHANCLTTEGGSCVAVKPDGDIVSVCKNMNSTDRGSDLLKRAIENGGDRLDAFGPGLYSFYTKNGFEPVSWTPFNEEYAPHDWDSSRDAKEPVVFYRYTGKKTEMSFTDFIRNTPKSTDYDEAKNIRDSKAGENK